MNNDLYMEETRPPTQEAILVVLPKENTTNHKR